MDFFAISKLLASIEQPLNWVFALLLLSALFARLNRPRSARVLSTTALLLMAFVGIVTIPDWLVQRLENLYPPVAVSSGFEGVIVMGGGIDGGLKPVERSQVSLNDAAERMTAALMLARTWPQLKIVCTGFAGSLSPQGISEAEAAARFFEEQGLPASRLILEPLSRNTYEIAVLAGRLPTVDPSKPWLLLTSAANMPRAINVFTKHGWNIHSFAVDYHTGTTLNHSRYSIMEGANAWSRFLHEALGIAAYWLSGRL